MAIWGMRLALALVVLASAVPAQSAWQRADSKHFIIYGDDKPDRIRTFAERLERFDQAVRLVRQMDDPPLTDATRLTIYILSSEHAVSRLIGFDAARGMYISRSGGSAAFVPRNAGANGGKWDLNTEQIFFHEYAHHLQLQTQNAALPAWVVEGFAEFFATANIEPDGEVEIGRYPKYRIVGLLVDTGLGIQEIVGGTYGSLNGLQTEGLYAQGWLLTHYFAFDNSRKGQLDKYIAGIQNGQTPIEAAKSAFGDLKALSRDIARYKHGKFNVIVVRPNQISIAPIAVRQLTEAQAVVMPMQIRSARGVNERSARDVAEDARRAAGRFPTDPSAQIALAEAEIDAGNAAAAEAAADRALAADPTSRQAMIFKGRAQMEAARHNPAAANWKAIRGWFSRANRLDPDAAEPLMRFYETFVASGAVPTANSVTGLLYAAALVPQDNALRMMATKQLLRDNRMAEAKTMFAPLAFSPHADEKWRQKATQIMAAIASGDSKAAVGIIEQEADKAARTPAR